MLNLVLLINRHPAAPKLIAGNSELQMAGTDTIRGITYQHACAIAACLDVLEDLNCAAIRVEGSDDVIDFDIVDTVGRRTRTAQVKSRLEPYTWPVRDISNLLKQWHELPGERSDHYDFISNGQLAPKAMRLIKGPLDELRRGAKRAQFDPLLDEAGLGELSDDFLRRVRLNTRHGDTQSVLDSSELRLLRLAEMSRRATPEEASARIDALFRQISVRAGSPNTDERTFVRGELANTLKVDTEAIDTAATWTRELADSYRKALAESPTEGTIILDALLDNTVHPALALKNPRVRDNQTEKCFSAKAIPDSFSRCSISGPAGAGKTTTLELMAHQAAKSGALPVLITPTQYTRGDLTRLIREALEAATGKFLALSTTDVVVDDEHFLLLLDGFTERPRDELNQLRVDLLEILSLASKPRAIVSGRRSDRFRLAEFPSLVLEGITSEQRKELAAFLLKSTEEAEAATSQIESALGDAASNPLLFTMALSLAAHGRSITSRAAIYRGMIEGLWDRQASDDPEELVEEALSRLASTLVDSGDFAQNRYAWLSLVLEILAEIRADGRLSLGNETAEDILEVATRVGLVRTPTIRRDISFLHDSFRDYLASVAYGRRTVALPPVITQDHEEAIAFLAEDAGVTPELATTISAQNPVLICRIARFARTSNNADSAAQAREVLSQLVQCHLGEEPKRHLGVTNVGVRLCWTATHSWVVIDNSGAAEVVDALANLNRSDLAATVVFAKEGHVGAIDLICAAWASLALKAIGLSGPPDRRWSRARFATPELLAKEVEKHAGQRQSALNGIARAALPSIAERLVTSVGPTGLCARIQPDASSHRGEHLMSYRYADGPHDVQLVDELPTRDGGQFWGQASAEYYLEKDPHQTAREELQGSLTRLLSGQVVS